MIAKRILAMLAQLNWGDIGTDGLCLVGLGLTGVGIHQILGEAFVWLWAGIMLLGLGILRIRGINGRPG